MVGRTRALVVAVVLALALLGACVAQGAGYYLSEHPPLKKDRKANVILIHGGGWEGIDHNGQPFSDADILMGYFIGQFQAWGYRAFNLAFRHGHALDDTYAAVKKVSKRYGNRPLCVFGGSSGGHLALMAAIKMRKQVDCVVSIGAPIDFVRPEPRERWDAMRFHAINTFGKSRLRKVSPMFHASRIKAATLVVTASCDYYTSVKRNREFVRKIKRGKLLVLDAAGPGEEGVNIGDHCPVTRASAERWRSMQKKFIDRSVKAEKKKQKRKRKRARR